MGHFGDAQRGVERRLSALREGVRSNGGLGLCLLVIGTTCILGDHRGNYFISFRGAVEQPLP